MKKLNVSFLLILSFVLLSNSFAQTVQIEKPANKKNESCETTDLISADVSEMKTLTAQGSVWIKVPFVFVARDAKTFEILKKTVKNLPEVSTIDFAKFAVIAAFAGEKGGKGNSVSITKSADIYSINFLPPPKKKLVTANVEFPFKVMLVPAETEKTLNLSISNDFKSAAKTYKISSSEFQYSGGFAFREKKFSADGTIEVMQVGELITLKFNLSGKDSESEMKLTETASGIMKNGKIELLRLDAESFSENPKPPVKILGSIDENKLILTFEPLPTDVADGFTFSGKIEAINN